MINPVFQPMGIDIFCFGRKFLIFNLVRRNLKLKYRQSALGFLWTLLVPALSAGVYYLVFRFIVKVQVEYYLTFILTGVLPWAFVSGSMGSGMESIVGNHSLVNKVPIPTYVFPYVESLTSFLNFAFALPVMAIFALFEGAPLGWSIFALIPFCGLLFVKTYCLSVLMGIGFVYFRDLRHALGVILQTWFYATPILYSTKMIPEKFYAIIYLNPVTETLRGFRYAFGLEPNYTLLDFGVSVAWTVGLFIITLLLISKVNDSMVEEL